MFLQINTPTDHPSGQLLATFPYMNKIELYINGYAIKFTTGIYLPILTGVLHVLTN